jgi:hypothetical protein
MGAPRIGERQNGFDDRSKLPPFDELSSSLLAPSFSSQ